MDTEFLTVEEIAKYLRLPLSTVYKLAQDNKIPGFKVGKHWRFRRVTFEKWIQQQETRDYSLERGVNDLPKREANP